MILSLELFKLHISLALTKWKRILVTCEWEISAKQSPDGLCEPQSKETVKEETRTQGCAKLKYGFSQTLCLLLALGFYSVKHSNSLEKKKKRRLTPVLHLSPLGVKKKMNVALNSVHLQTNGLTLPPPSLSCPPPHHTLCPLLWIKTCTHTCTHRESCPLIKGLVSPNPRFLPCRKCLSF